MNRKAKFATGMDGRKIQPGDFVISAKGVYATVMRIHRQGYDGTIITTDIAPDPDYPHHFSGVAKTTFRKA